jgi:hypothetical protein
VISGELKLSSAERPSFFQVSSTISVVGITSNFQPRLGTRSATLAPVRDIGDILGWSFRRILWFRNHLDESRTSTTFTCLFILLSVVLLCYRSIKTAVLSCLVLVGLPMLGSLHDKEV